MSKTSKTARASTVKKKGKDFEIAPDMDRIISLNGGRHAYVLDYDEKGGKTRHLATDSAEFAALVEKLDLHDEAARKGLGLDGVGQ